MHKISGRPPVISAIIPAAGKGKRFGSGTPKLFVSAGGKPILYHTLKNIADSWPFAEVIIASDPLYFRPVQKIIRSLGLTNARVVKGGLTRAESVRNALSRVSETSDWVLIHDAARPLVSRRIVRGVVAEALKQGAAIAALPATATVKRVARHRIRGTEDRRFLYLAQTPQLFKKQQLLTRYERLGSKAFNLTDEASFFDGTRIKVSVAPGAVSNLKITTREDLELFKFYLKLQ